MKKKLLATMLSMCMILSLIPGSAFAAEKPAEQPESAATASAVTEVKTAEDLKAAVEKGGTIKLMADVTLTGFLTIEKELTIDLNGMKLNTDSHSVILQSGANVTLKNGTVEALHMPASTSSLFHIMADSRITLDKVKINTNGTALFPEGDAASVTVRNSEVNGGGYAVATNATTDNKVVINLSDSKFSTSHPEEDNHDNCAIMINVNGELTMNNCTVTGDRQGVMVRGGKAAITNCNITCTGTYAGIGKYLNGNWGSGNDVPMGALVVGNRSESYHYPASCEIKNSTIVSKNSKVPAIYMYGMDESNRLASLTVGGSSTSVTGTQNIGGTVNFTVSGGTFSAPVDPKYLTEGYAQNDAGVVGPLSELAVAQIGETKYATLKEAVAAVLDGETITLLADVSNGSGVIVPEDKNFTLDFGGHTYTVTHDLAGSSGTQSQCFQLLKGSTLTFKNGTIKANNAYIAMLIQNYSNLTLVNMKLDGTSMTRTGTNYVLSCNNGATTLTGNTNITAKQGDIAFDVCSFSNYQDVSVTVKNAVINGDIEWTGLNDNKYTAALNIEGGTINGTIKNSKNRPTEGISVSGGSFTKPLPANAFVDTTDYANQTTTSTPQDGYIDVKVSGTAHVATSGSGAGTSGSTGKTAYWAGWRVNLPGVKGYETLYVWSGADLSALKAAAADDKNAAKATINDADGKEFFCDGHSLVDKWTPGDHWFCYELRSVNGTPLTAKTYFKANMDEVKLVDDENGTFVPVYFRVVNGTWADGKTDSKIINIKLTDDKGTLAAADVPTGMKPNSGYENGKWDVTPNTEKDGITKSVVYTYTFTKKSAPSGGSSAPVVKPTDKCDGGVNCPTKHLLDVDKNAWYHNAVDYAVSKHLMTGTSAVTFDPQLTTSRGMVVTILYNLEGRPAVTAPNPFKDVADGVWYTDAIRWAAANGIVAGCDSTTFAPDAPVTREQLAVILYHYAAHKGYNVTSAAYLGAYSDADQISSWAMRAMQWANAKGLINGTTATTIAPQLTADRAQTASILRSFCENVAK